MTVAKQRIFLFFIGGSVSLFLGGFYGMLLGIVFGGMLTAIIDIPKIYGGLPGYEGTGALGFVVGASTALFFWIKARLQGRLRRDAYILLGIASIVTFIAQNHLWMGLRWKSILFLPIIAQALLFAFHKEDAF